jgi:hypothetical protein
MEETAAAELQRTVVETIDGLLAEVYATAGVSSANVYEMVVAGNMTMLHLLLGVDAHAISVAPFIPAFREPLDLPAAALGVDIHPEGRIQILPSLGAPLPTSWPGSRQPDSPRARAVRRRRHQWRDRAGNADRCSRAPPPPAPPSRAATSSTACARPTARSRASCSTAPRCACR